jgi:hypothetical protein
MENNIERVEKLLALILLEQSNKKQEEKAKLLNLAGFSNLEIADLLGIESTQTIANYLYKVKKSKTKKKK